MKIFFSILAIITICLFFNFKKAEIPVTIHFKNSKNADFKKGKITIQETNQTFEINSLEDFTILLEKGKYTITFTSEEFQRSWITKRITKNDSTFNFVVLNRANSNTETFNKFSEENLKKAIEKGDAKFINFGLAMVDFTKFEKKYGIGNSNQGCVISGNIGEYARQNNLFLTKYLDAKFGESWREDVPFLPWGLEAKEN